MRRGLSRDTKRRETRKGGRDEDSWTDDAGKRTLRVWTHRRRRRRNLTNIPRPGLATVIERLAIRLASLMPRWVSNR